MQRFDEKFRDAFKQAVREVEQDSGVELVITLLPRVEQYYIANVIFGIICSFSALTILMFIPTEVWYIQIWYETLIAGVLGFFLLFAISPLKRLILGKKYLHWRVEEKANAVFQHNQLYETQKRTGVLVMLSFFEKQVIIIADDGAEQMMPPKEITSMKMLFRNAFSAKYPPAAILEAIEASKGAFKKYIPRNEDDVNELPDELWMN